jgi:hypothetical protein
MKSIKTLILIFILLILPWKGYAMDNNTKMIEQINNNYAKLNLSDGISEEEALIIAQHFIINDSSSVFSNVVIMRGKVMESGLKNVIGDCWVVSFTAKLKFKWQTGLKWFDVHIDKTTGDVKTTGWGPS